MTLCLADVLAARVRIAGTALRTPLIPSPALSRRAGAEVLLKLETTQPTGAFKLRGAANALAALGPDVAGVACSSTGNHGRAVAYAARAKGLRAAVFMSRLVPATKVEGIRALGAEVHIVGESQDEAQVDCERFCASEGFIDVSPFDDADVIAGQGTIGLELLEDRPDLETLVIPLSGGGLAGGIALAAKAIKPSIRIVGVTMDNGPAMYHSIRAGHPVEVVEMASLADSLGGGIGAVNQLTLALCRDLIDETVLVSEEEIYRAMQALYYEDRQVAEGGAAVGVAALLAGRVTLGPGPVGVVVSGRNVDMARFTRIVTGADVVLGDHIIAGRAYAPV